MKRSPSRSDYVVTVKGYRGFCPVPAHAAVSKSHNTFTIKFDDDGVLLLRCYSGRRPYQQIYGTLAARGLLPTDGRFQ